MSSYDCYTTSSNQETFQVDYLNPVFINFLTQGPYLPSMTSVDDSLTSFFNSASIFNEQGCNQSLGNFPTTPGFSLDQFNTSTDMYVTQEVEAFATNQPPIWKAQEPTVEPFPYPLSPPAVIEFSDSDVSPVSSPTLSMNPNRPPKKTRNRLSMFKPFVTCRCGTVLTRLLHIANHLLRNEDCAVMCNVKNCGHEMTQTTMKQHLETAHPVTAKRNRKIFGMSK